MSSSKPKTPKDPDSVTVLGPRDSLVGVLSIEGSLRVQGVAGGELRANGDIRIDESAIVNASLDGRNVSVRGRVTGNGTDSERLLLARPGTPRGRIWAARLAVEGRDTVTRHVHVAASGERTETGRHAGPDNRGETPGRHR